MVLAFYEGAKLDFKLIREEKNHASCAVLDLQFYEIYSEYDINYQLGGTLKLFL